MADTRHKQILPETNRAEIVVFSRFALIGFILAAGLFVAARLWHLAAACLWFDELFSVHAARHEWRDLLSFVAADIVHPPLFYLLLKVWITIGGESLLWLRLFPAVAAIATLIPFFFLCRELKLRPAEINLAIVLMGVSGHLIKYAQELRMYSLLLLLTLCSLLLFVRFLNSKSKKRVALLFAVNLLLVYTHYFGWMVIGVEWLALLVWERRKLLLFSAASAGLALFFAPWAYAVVQAGGAKTEKVAQNIGWASRPGLYELAEYYASVSGLLDPHRSATWLGGFGALVFGCSVALWLRYFFKSNQYEDRHRVRTVKLLLLFSFAPIVFAFSLSYILPQSIWGTRHLIIAVVPYLLLVSVALHRLPLYQVRITALILVGCWSLFAAFLLLVRTDGDYVWCAWEVLTRRMIQATPKDSGSVNVYAFEDLVAYHVWFSLDSAHEKRFHVSVVKGVPGQLEDAAYFLPRRFDEVAVRDATALSEDKYWVAFREASTNQDSSILEMLSSNGYQVGEGFSVNAYGNKAFLVPVRRR
ncbi:MAG: hypothetical protein ABR577_13875 [Pyrinomonadaceae bacterium]